MKERKRERNAGIHDEGELDGSKVIRFCECGCGREPDNETEDLN